MLQILKELGSVFLGIVGIVVPTFLALWIYYKQRDRKKLLYIILNDYQLINPIDKGELQVFYKDEAIENVRLLLVRIFNGGNKSILKNDFEDDLIISFSENCKVLNAEKVNLNPENLDIEFSQLKNSNKISIKPCLINQEDSFDLKILVDRKTDFKISARIAGIENIREVKNSIEVASGFISGYWIAGLFSPCLSHWVL